MSKPSKSFKIGRDSETGRLKSVEDAWRDPKGSTVEHMPKAGFGTAEKSKN